MIKVYRNLLLKSREGKDLILAYIKDPLNTLQDVESVKGNEGRAESRAKGLGNGKEGCLVRAIFIEDLKLCSKASALVGAEWRAQKIFYHPGGGDGDGRLWTNQASVRILQMPCSVSLG